MKLKDIDLKLTVKDGIIDLKLKTPGLTADVELDHEAYSAWAKPESLERPAGAEKPAGEPPVDNGLSTSPSFTLNEWMLIITYLAQALREISVRRSSEEDGEEDGQDVVDPEQPNDVAKTAREAGKAIFGEPDAT